MNQFYTRFVAAIAFSFFLFLNTQLTAATKTWQLTTGSGAWTTGANWSGGSTPSANDVIDFSLGGTVTVTAVPTFTANQLLVSGSTNVTLQPSGNNTLTIAGAFGVDFSIANGSSLTVGIIAGNFLSITNSASGNTASIDGNFTMLATTAAPTFSCGTGTAVNTVGSTGNIINNVNAASITSNASTLVFNGTYTHGATTSNGTIPTASWNTGSTCIVSGYTSTNVTPSGIGQSFYNFTWNCPSQGAATGLAGAITTINGDFTIAATGSGKDVRLCSSNGSAYTLTIGGNLIISGGQLSLIGSGTSGSNTSTITVNGSVQLSNAGILEFNAASNAGTTTLIVKGDFITANTSTIKKSFSATANINFQKSSGTQTFGQTGTSSIANNINFNIGNGTTTNTVQLTSAVNLGTGTGTTTINNNASLDFQTNTLSGSCAFTTSSGSTLISANTNSAGAFITSSGTGSVQTSGTRTFTAGANYTFNGAGAQFTGNAVTAPGGLTINNSSGVTLTNAATLTGTLTLTSGVLDIAALDLTVSGTTAGAISGGSSTAYVATSSTGNLIRGIATAGLPITYPFPIGKGGNYTPASFTFSANNTARNLKARVVTPRHSNDATATDYINNRYWATDLSVSTGTYSYTSVFTFLGGDVVGTVGNIKLDKWNGSVWAEPSGSSASGTTLSSGSLTETTASLAATAEWVGRVNATTFSYTWTGTNSSSWGDGGNWSGGAGGTPTSADDITINGTGSYTNPLIITAAQSITNFTLSSNGTFQITSSGSLAVSGGFTTTGSSGNPTFDCASTLTISSSSSQNIPAWSYGNLNLTGGNRVLASSGSIGVCGTLTPGSGTYTITGSTVDFNGSGSQTIPAMTYNNLTSSSSGARTLASSGSVKIAGTFTPGSNSYTITGSTVDYNGSGTQTVAAFNYNNLTISGAHTTNNITLINGGTIGVNGTLSFTATFSSGTYVSTNNTIDFTSSSSQTIPIFSFYNSLINSGNGARTLANGTIRIYDTYTPTTGAVTIGTSTIDFAGVAGQVMPATFYYAVTNSTNTNRTWASSGVIDIANTFTPSTATNTITGSTIKYSAASGNLSLSTFTTNIASRLYNNLIFGVTSATTFWTPASTVNIGVAGNLTILGGTLNIGSSTTASTMNVDGDVSITGGSIAVCTSSSGNSGTLNIYGNLSVSGGTLTRGNLVSTGVATVNFIKSSGTQTLTHSSGTISNGLNINIGDGTSITNTVQLLSNVTLSLAGGTTYPIFTVLNGSGIDFGTNTISSSGGGTFNAQSGSTVITANTAGLVSSGASGSVQTVTRTFSSAANYTYNAAAGQVSGVFTTAPTANTINALTINNSSNVTLSQNITTAGTLTLTAGLLDLSTFNLIANGTISGASLSTYIKTSSSGQLKRTVGAGNVDFPIGLSAYNPITLDNTGGTSDVYGMGVIDALNNAADATYGVTREWVITEGTSGNSNLTVTGQWNTSETGVNYTSAATQKVGFYDQTGNVWIENTATTSGSNPYTTASNSAFNLAAYNLTSGTWYFAVGKDYAFIPQFLPPSLTSTTSTTVTDVSATLGATITADNGNAVTDYGTVYGASSNPTGNASSLGAYAGSYSYVYTDGRIGLLPQTLYHTRGFATNSAGTGYSNDITFRTQSISPTSEATGFGATTISPTQINLSWTAATLPGSGYTAHGYIILYRTDGTNPTTTNVIDATAPGSLSLPSGTSLATTIANITTVAYSHTSLSVYTPYNYIIIPFTWDGTNAATYNYYLTNAPNTNATTLDATLATDYFQSFTSGNFGTAATWESSHNGTSNWITSTLVPTTTANTITVLNGHNVTVAASVSADQLVINTGGTLTVNSTFTLSVANGSSTDLIVNGTISNAGTIDLATSSTAQINSGATYYHNQNGNGAANDLINTTAATWDANSNFEVIGWAGATTASLLSSSVVYGNFRWNSASQSATFNNSLSSLHFAGNYRISNSNTTSGMRINNSGSTLTVDGDIIIDGGVMQMGNSATGTNIINVGGNFTLTSGTFNPNTSTTCAVNFTGTNKTFTFSGGTLTNSQINWTVNSGASLSLANDIPVAASRSLTVNGTLNMATNLATGAGAFTLASGGTLGIGSIAGLTSAGTTGNVQVTGSKSYSSSANYVYNGVANQITGVFTTTPTASTINTLTINNTGGTGSNTVSLTNSISLAATTNSLQMIVGKLNLNGNSLTVPNGGTVSSTSGDFSGTTGTVIFAGTGTVTGTVNFASVTLNGAVNFGSASTIQSTLQMNSGGSVVTNAPSYSSTSTLLYYTGGTANRGLEWSSTSGAGYPKNVTIDNSTILNLGNGGTSTARSISGSLTINNNTKLKMNAVGDEMTAPLTIGGDLHLDGQLSLSTLAGGDLYLKGDYYYSFVSGSLIQNGRKVFFTGSISQTLFTNSGTGTITFDDIEIDKPSLSSLDLNSIDLTVANQMVLTNGIIATGSKKVTVSNNVGNAIAAGTGNTNYTAGWVNGNLRRNFASNTDTYDFPVGSNSRGNLLQMVNNSLAGVTYLDCSIAAKGGNDNGLSISQDGTPAFFVASEGEWKLTPDALPSGGTYDLRLYFNGFTSITGLYDNYFSVIERPDGSTNAADWVTPSGSTHPALNTPGMTLADGYAGRLGMSTFSLKGIAIHTGVLPLTLTSFTASAQNAAVVTKWETAMEKNVNHFEIERSTDGTSFEKIGTQSACGNCNFANHYTLIDENPAQGVNYYRLKSIDNDGKFSYSMMVAVMMGAANSVSVLAVYPNPANSAIKFDYTTTSNSQTTLKIYSVAGTLLDQFQLEKGTHTQAVNTSEYQVGLYLYEVISNDKVVKSGKFNIAK